MSSGSYFTLYRKTGKKLENEELLRVIRRYEELDVKLDGEPPSPPPVIDTRFEDTTDDSHTYTTAEGERLIRLLDWSFGSGFTCIREEYGMNPCRNRDRSHEVSVAEAHDMIQALDYLESGEWSDRFETVLRNDWIRILSAGNSYGNLWRYADRKRDKHAASDTAASDIADEELEWRANARRLRSALSALVESDTPYDGDELVLTYTVY